MNYAIRAIRKQVRFHRRTRAAKTVPYPGSVREAAVSLAREQSQAGIPVRRTAHELGLRPQTLYLWLSRKPSKGLRPVTITDNVEPTAELPEPRPVLVTPQGFRIEGLDAVRLVALLRGLS
jgi:hypothetical protein